MKLIVKTTAAVCIMAVCAYAPAAQAQFGFDKLVDSAKKELNKASEPKSDTSSDSNQGLDAYNKKYKNYEKTIAQGAGLGALVGGVAGYALGGSEEAVAIGAGVGALAGGALGKQIADRSDNITKNRKRLEKALKESEKFRAKNLEMLEATKMQIVELETRIKDLESAYYSGDISKAELKGKLASVKETETTLVANLSKDIDRLTLREGVMAEAANKARSSEDAEVQALASKAQTERYAIGNVKTVQLATKSSMTLLSSKLVNLEVLAG